MFNVKNTGKLLAFLLTILLSLSLVGCSDDDGMGSSDDSGEQTSENGTDSTNGNSSTGDSEDNDPGNGNQAEDAELVFALGHVDDDGKLISEPELIGATAWKVNSPHQLKIQLYKRLGSGEWERAFATETAVKFMSDCALLGTAEFSREETTSVSGSAETIYIPRFNCVEDMLHISVSRNGEPVEGVDDIFYPVSEIKSAHPHALQFIGFVPEVELGAEVPRVGRSGGASSDLLPKTIDLIFELQDSSRNPVGIGYPVSFELFGVELIDSVGKSDLEGCEEDDLKCPRLVNETAWTDAASQVGVTLAGGQKSAVFNVVAQLSDLDEGAPDVKAVSPSVFVSSGFPHEDRFNLFWVREDIDRDQGSFQDLQFKVVVGDEHGQPVPGGTLIHFLDQSGGAAPYPVMQESCVTGFEQESKGRCSVGWYGDTRLGDPKENPESMVEVIAWALGEGGARIESKPWTSHFKFAGSDEAAEED